MNKCLDHHRVKEIININRMIHPTPEPDNVEYNVEGNYLRGLADLVDDWVKPGFVMCEIGSYMGKSSELFSLFVEKIYCVDIWDSLYCPSYVEPIFDDTISSYTNIVKIKKESTVASGDFQDRTFDMIYIDGDHSEEGFRKDMIHWVPKVKEIGVIAGHDYHLICGVLKEYVNLDLVRRYKDGSWAYFKKESL